MKKLLLGSALIFSSLIFNYKNLHASNNMQQKAAKATLGQPVNQATAKELIEHKDEMTKFEKKFKGKVPANVYVAKKKAGKSDEDILAGR